MESLEDRVSSCEKQLQQSAAVLTDLVVRLTAMERLLIDKAVIKEEDYSSQINTVLSEVQNVMKALLEKA